MVISWGERYKAYWCGVGHTGIQARSRDTTGSQSFRKKEHLDLDPGREEKGHKYRKMCEFGDGSMR